MKKPGTRPTVKHAFDFVKEHLDNGTWKQGECLPPVRRLASMAAVSIDTMAKAVALLKAGGLVHGTERRRMRAGECGAEIVRDPEAPAKWRQKRALLETDIFCGVFSGRGALPTLKELQTRYDVGYETMKKVMQSLLADRVVVSNRKGYALPLTAFREGANRLLFITCAGFLNTKSALNMENRLFVDLLGNECSRNGLRLDIQEIDFYDAMSSGTDIGKIRADRVLGFVVDVWWVELPTVRRQYESLVEHLAGRGKTVVLLDELGNLDLSLRYRSSPMVHRFGLEGRRAGARIARYLLGLGHREVVYISGSHHHDFSKARFEGVQNQLGAVGASGTRAHLVSGTITILDYYAYAAAGLTDADLRRLFALNHGLTGPQAEDKVINYRQFLKSGPLLIGKKRYHDELLREVLDLVLKRESPGSDYASVCNEAIAVSANRMRLMMLRPLFDRARGFRNATAWICANDNDAFEALRFLRGKAVDVPGEISVVGFDNTPIKAHEYRLTSYDFNAMGFVGGILSCITRPRRSPTVHAHSPIEVEGFIHERESAGPAMPSAHAPHPAGGIGRAPDRFK